MQVEEGQAVTKEPRDLEEWANVKSLGWKDNTVNG